MAVLCLIGTASANSVELDLGCTSKIYFYNVTLSLPNVMRMPQKPCQHNNKCDCKKKKNGYKLILCVFFFHVYVHKLHFFLLI